jgi:hypothetical protein
VWDCMRPVQKTGLQHGQKWGDSKDLQGLQRSLTRTCWSPQPPFLCVCVGGTCDTNLSHGERDVAAAEGRPVRNMNKIDNMNKIARACLDSDGV